MSDEFSYSVAIRTLGTAGEKYKKLLDSIKNQTIQPEKVIVVLPYGYEPPEYQLGIEEFVFCEKGMIKQRFEAIKHISSNYILFCDDDIEFGSDFVLKLSEPLVKGEYDCSAAPLLDLFPPKSIKYKMASLLGGACVMLHGRQDNYVRILKTGGWSYNRSINVKEHKIYNSESIAGACFLTNTHIISKLNFEDELWAEKNGYPAFEDRIVIGKFIVNGSRVAVVSDTKYIHNDGKTSTKNVRLEPIYAGSFNHYVFWHRFIYEVCSNKIEKAWAKLCINYYIFMSRVYSFCLYKSKRYSKEICMMKKKGFEDAKKFVKSQEYKSLAHAKF